MTLERAPDDEDLGEASFAGGVYVRARYSASLPKITTASAFT